MAKTNTTKSTTEDNVKDVNIDVTENVDEKEKKNTKKTIKSEPLNDDDEIEIISLVPNVSYKDSKTGDMYEWDVAGHVEPMTVDVLKNMWRSNKGYFKNMWLKPNDERLIKQFGLTKTFEKHEFLMDASNYTKENIKSICEAISETPNGLKFAICDKIKNFVIDGEISNVSVIKTLEKHLKIDLIEFLE